MTDRSDRPAEAARSARGDPQRPPDDAVEDAYDWYTRGLELLDAGSPAAAALLLERASAAEPDARSILEALGRAQFKAREYERARATFTQIVEANPADDYAQFALGLSAARTGDLRAAVEHLALASAMRPGAAHYGRELRMARARLQGAT
jgi:tetratricopeptide (TPR) repeat protein